MNRKLFELALERLAPSDWAHFERLSSDFLASELPNLRTMASPSGDGGRDSELFSPDGKPLIAVQYSVAKDWRTKVRRTAKRLKELDSPAKVLIYTSNQQIGALADELKSELLTDGLMLDPRDRSWFLERALTDAVRENASNQLIDIIARPYLAGEEVINKKTSPLTSGEARAALVYLGLQWQDDISEKGLTKLSFDALVRAALRHTSSNSRMTRKQIHDAIDAALASAERSTVCKEVDKALARLTKRFIRHWNPPDEFCLTHDECQRIQARLAEVETERSGFYDVVESHCVACLDEIDGSDEQDLVDLPERVIRVLERLLLKRGEAFVEAVISESLHRIGLSDLADLILDDVSSIPPRSAIIQYYPRVVTTTIQAMLAEPTESTHRHLKRLANSYTLLSFLKQTPDVQSATKKLFSHGMVWVDTTVLLPLFAEQLEEDDSRRRLSRILAACAEAGTELRVTTGIIQEVNAHMNIALKCSQYQAGTWRGRTPYLYYQYLHTGSAPASFSQWLSLFKGTERPEDDLAQYLHDVFGIEKADLDEAAREMPDKLRWALDRLWADAHESKRRNTQQIDDSVRRKLIAHDIETYLGVVALRKKENVSELGYRNWLLTLDRNAWEIRDQLREEFKDEAPTSPLLSLSFLLNTMVFSPSRSQVGKASQMQLPLLLDVEMSESFSHDIIETADRVRRENDGAPEYVIRRRVRDAIDKARRRRGAGDYSSTFDDGDAEQTDAPDGYSAGAP